MKNGFALFLLVALIVIAACLVLGFIHIPAGALDTMSQNASVPAEGINYLLQWK